MRVELFSMLEKVRASSAGYVQTVDVVVDDEVPMLYGCLPIVVELAALLFAALALAW